MCVSIVCGFNRCMQCQPIPQPLLNQFYATCVDRLRLPSCFGSGALRIIPDLLPIFVLPACLLIAALHYLVMVFSFVVMFIFIAFAYRIWTHQYRKQRLAFFYVWGLTSFAILLAGFEHFVYSRGLLFCLDNYMMLVGTCLVCLGLKHIKKDPGTVPSYQYNQDSGKFDFGVYTTSSRSEVRNEFSHEAMEKNHQIRHSDRELILCTNLTCMLSAVLVFSLE